MSKRGDVDTDDFIAPPATDRSKDTPSSLVRVDLAGVSHQGNVRPNNQDHFLAVRFERSLETLLSNLPQGEVAARSTETGYGMVVADGLGGHAAGEVASRKAVSTLTELALRTPDWIMRLDDESIQVVCRRMEERFQEVSDALTDKARVDPTLFGMGTTMTLAASVGADLVIAHAGDSRAYLFRQGRLQQLTHDHTVAQGLADLGVISADEAAVHGARHVLTSVIGAGGGRVRVDLLTTRLADGDQLLLCTDGLPEMVPEDTVAKALRESNSAAEACRTLLDLALDGGGKDNVTVVVARYRMPKKKA